MYCHYFFKKNNMIKYSYIIPHKNSLELLLRCIDSIEDKEHSQIIVVDDNSNNQSILVEALKAFPSVELILLKSNQGAGAARNVGLTRAKAKWILFADADDFFNVGYLKAIEKYYASQTEIVFFDTDCRFSDTLELTENRFPDWSTIIKSKDVEKSKWAIPVVWGKMYLKDFIIENSISFDEVFASNDVMFCYKANLLAKLYVIDDFVLYCSTKNPNSLCYCVNENNIACRIQVLYRTNALLRSIGMNKYQYNIFSLILLYYKIGLKIFLSESIKYLRDTSINNLYWDLLHTMAKIYSKLYKIRRNNKSFKQQVINTAFFNSTLC